MFERQKRLESDIKAKPFIKWAGGETQLLPQLREHYPQETPSIYIEPFVGAGAVMFDVAHAYPEL